MCEAPSATGLSSTFCMHFRFADLQRALAGTCSSSVDTPLASRASNQARYVFEGRLVDEGGRSLRSTAKRLTRRHASLNTRLLLRTERVQSRRRKWPGLDSSGRNSPTCCVSYMSKLRNRQNAPSVPDSEIRTNLTIRQNRNNRYLLRKTQSFNELRNARNGEVVPANSILPIIPVPWVVTVIMVIYTLSKRNAQVAGQH